MLVFLGRTHLYEGRGVDAVVHGVRTAAAAGCRTVVLTNGCGGLNPTWEPGTPVLISDHINLTAASPLRGATFVDLTDLYSPGCGRCAGRSTRTLPEGVYVQFRGPQYETPAEMRMVRHHRRRPGRDVDRAGGDRRPGGRLEVLGLSLVTNLAAGMTGEPLNHEEVLDAGRAAAERWAACSPQVVTRL